MGKRRSNHSFSIKAESPGKKKKKSAIARRVSWERFLLLQKHKFYLVTTAEIWQEDSHGWKVSINLYWVFQEDQLSTI